MSPADDRTSLGDRVATTLTDDVPSIATGIVVAIPVSYGVQGWTGEFAASFFVLLLAGVSVPGLVDRYASTSGIRADVVATIVGCLAVFAAFLALFAVLDEVVAGTVAAALSFVVVSLGSPLLLANVARP